MKNAQVQLSITQQQKVDSAISKAAGQIPGFQQFINQLNQGDPIIITDDNTTFKFSKKVENIPFSNVLTTIGGLVNNHQSLSNPIVKGFEKIFNDNSITAEITVNEPNSEFPNYTVSILGAALNLEFEFFFGHGSEETNFVLALSPSNLKFETIHPEMKVFDELGKPGLALILSDSSLEPDMAILRRLELDEFEVEAGLTILSNIAVKEESQLGALFKIKNLVAHAQIPLIPSSITLTASVKPEWPLGNDARITDGTVYMSLEIGDSGPELAIGTSMTLQTDLPSDAIGVTKSTVDWTVNGEISGSPDESGYGTFRLGMYGKMDGVWETPFGSPDLDIYSGGAEFGLNVEIKQGPGFPVVTVVPDLAIRGKIGIGRGRSMEVEYAGKIDIAEPQSSGLTFDLVDVGLGRAIDLLMYSYIGRELEENEIISLDKIVLDRGKLSLWLVEGEIAGETYPAGLGLAGAAQIFGVGGGIEMSLTPDGIIGDVSVLPLEIKSGNTEFFSFSGTEKGSPMLGSVNIQWSSLLDQLKDAYHGTPFLTLDARLGFMGMVSQTKLVLNPIKGSYFSTNTKLWNALDVKLEGEVESLGQFGNMRLKGAFDKASTEEFNRILITEFDALLQGLIPEGRIAELTVLIETRNREITSVRKQIEGERKVNSAKYENAKGNLQGLQNEYNRLSGLAVKSWAEHNALPFLDFVGKARTLAETNRLNAEKTAVSIPLNAAKAFLDTLQWVNNLPVIDLDPRVSSLVAERDRFINEKIFISEVENVGEFISGRMKEFHDFFKENGIGEIVDVEQVEFEGEIGLLSGGNLKSMINLKLMGEKVSVSTDIGVKPDGTLDLKKLLGMLKNKTAGFQLGYAPSFAAEIGTKYDYSKKISPVKPVERPVNISYTPSTSQAGNTSNFASYAVNFNGSSDFQEETGDWGKNWTEMTIEAWVKGNGSNGEFQTIVSGNEGFVHLQMHHNPNANNAVFLTNGATILLPMIPDVSTEWQHIALVVKSGDSRLYQNGELIGQPSNLEFGASTIAPTNKIRLGGNINYGGRHLNGELANVYIWKRAKSQTEIKANMNTVPSNTTGLVSNFCTDSIDPVIRIGSRFQSFDAGSQVSIPAVASQNLSQMTIEAWVKNDGGTEAIQAIVSSANLDFVHLQASANSAVQSVVYVNNGGVSFPAVPQALGVWQHVAIVVQSGNSQMYINGTPHGSKDTKVFNSINPGSSIFVGQGYQNGRKLLGSIANVRIWNTARSQAELSNNWFNFNIDSNSPDLVYCSSDLN